MILVEGSSAWICTLFASSVHMLPGWVGGGSTRCGVWNEKDMEALASVVTGCWRGGLRILLSCKTFISREAISGHVWGALSPTFHCLKLNRQLTGSLHEEHLTLAQPFLPCVSRWGEHWTQWSPSTRPRDKQLVFSSGSQIGHLIFKLKTMPLSNDF